MTPFRLLAVTRQPGANPHALYHGWLAMIAALRAATITGRVDFVAERVACHEARRTALVEHARLSAELTALRAAANKEHQLNRRVDLNLAIRHLESELQSVAARL